MGGGLVQLPGRVLLAVENHGTHFRAHGAAFPAAGVAADPVDQRLHHQSFAGTDGPFRQRGPGGHFRAHAAGSPTTRSAPWRAISTHSWSGWRIRAAVCGPKSKCAARRSPPFARAKPNTANWSRTPTASSCGWIPRAGSLFSMSLPRAFSDTRKKKYWAATAWEPLHRCMIQPVAA